MVIQILKLFSEQKPGEDSYINVDANGANISNFGIGTASPNSKLEVVGDTILSGSLAVSQSFTASGLYYPDTDGTDGQVLTTDGLGNLSFQTIEDVYVTVKNVSGGTLYKGTPVHATSSISAGNATPVIAASASNALTMPATFVLNEQIADEAEGQALLSGFIQGVNTSLFEVGEVVYVGENGGFTNVKPTGSNNLIQNLGIVTKIHASNGSGWIYGSGRSNDVPNLPTGKIWVGSDTYSVTSSVISLDETNNLVQVTGSINASKSITSSGAFWTTKTGSEDDPAVLIGQLSGWSLGNKAGFYLEELAPGFYVPYFTSDGTKKMGFGADIGLETNLSLGTNKIYFDNDTISTYIQSDNDNPENLEIHADQNIELRADNILEIYSPISTSFSITGSDVYIDDFPSVSASLAAAGDGNVSNTGTPVNNQVAVWTNSTTIEGDADFTWSGTTLTIDGSTKTRVTAVANDGVGGTVNALGEFGYGAEVWQGPGISDTTAGRVYTLKTDGTMTLAKSGSEAFASGFLSYATAASSVNGMVLRGFVYVGNVGQSPGDKIYLADDGQLTATRPTTSTHFVRIMGYASANTGIIYFSPSNDYIQLA